MTGIIIKEEFSENLFKKDPELSVDIKSSKCTSCGFVKHLDCTVFHKFTELMNSHIKSSACALHVLTISVSRFIFSVYSSDHHGK